jgi:hypothetical protein
VYFRQQSEHVKYHSAEYHINGEMDAGIFLDKSATCVLPWEDKNMGGSLVDKDIAQIAAAMAGKLEALKYSYDISPPRYCGILTNGRTWILVTRYVKNGVRMWHITTPVTVINDKGEIKNRAMFTVCIFLYHALVVAEDVLKSVINQIVDIDNIKLLSITEDDGDNHGDSGDDSDDDEEKTNQRYRSNETKNGKLSCLGIENRTSTSQRSTTTEKKSSRAPLKNVSSLFGILTKENLDINNKCRSNVKNVDLLRLGHCY